MSIVLRDIFEKPVDRAIDGVIKADDEASLRIELDEYVITGEIGQRLGQFLDAYNNYDTANGVWISGFFGSGKSHLLKMLALLLENREVDGTTAFDIFAEKLKDDPMLLGALRKAVSIPSKSILFNIDQKADVIAKTDTDALLGVFQKVFDEMCGYYGKLQHIAQFERDLDQIGQLATFKDQYQEIAGEPWEAGREIAKLRGGKIAEAYAAATGSDPADVKGILDRYRQDTRVSIEEGKHAFHWTRLSCRKFRANEVRLQLHALAYNLATFLRCIELPEAMADWSLTSLQLKLIKIGARVVRHARAITFQLAEVAVTGPMVRAILAAIRRLRAPPSCA